MARPLTVNRWLTTITTAAAKYGTGSGNFKDPASNAVNPYVYVTDNSFAFGTGNFTIELWLYRTSAVNQRLVFAANAASGTNNYYWVWNADDLTFANEAPGTANDVSAPTGGNAVPLNDGEWYHLALVRNGTSLKQYVNGIEVGSTAVASKSIGSNSELWIGYLDTGLIWDLENCYVDDYRVSNIARYTANFTPPGNIIDDANTLLLLKFNGTNGSTNIVDTVNYTLDGAANLAAAATVDKADGRTFLRASADLSALATQLTVQNPSPGMVYLQNDVYTWADTDTWDTIYDSDDKWAVYERLNALFALSVQAETFDIGSSQQFGEFILFAKGGLEQNGNARLEDAFTQTAKGGLLIGIDDPYDYTWDTVPEDQWNGFFTDQWRPSGWFAFDAVTLTSRGGLALDGASTLNSTATVNAVARLSDVRGTANLNSAFTVNNVDGRTFLRASADLNSEFTLASGSDNSKSGSATLEAFAAEVTVARLSDVRGSANLVSQFTLTSGSDLYRNGSSTLEAQANLTIAGAMTLNAGVILDTAFALESNSRILKLANLDITSLGDLAVSATLTLNAGTNLASNFTQTALAGYSLSGSANLAAQFTEIVRPTLIPSVQLGELTATASLTVNGVMTFNGVANLEALATEVTVGQRVQGAKANLEAAFSTVIAGSTILAGRSTLEAFAAQLTAGRLSDTRGSATLSGTFVAEFAGELKLLDSQFIYMVLNENRTFGIESETRNHDVLSENRLFDIEQESRDYQVLPENRIVDVGYFMQ